MHLFQVIIKGDVLAEPKSLRWMASPAVCMSIQPLQLNFETGFKNMINVIATIKIKPGTRDSFVEAFNENVPAVLEEAGCIEYFPATDAETGIESQDKDENAVVVIEKWESVDHLKAHLNAPHMVAFRDKAGHMIESLSIKVLEKA